MSLARAAAFVALLPGCVLLYDFDDYGEGAGPDGGGGQATGGTAAGGASAGGGGNDGGGGEAPACSDGILSDSAPWSVVLGPFPDEPLTPGYGPVVSVALQSDRLVFGAVARQIGQVAGLRIDGAELVPGESNAFVVGWVDEQGTVGRTLTLDALVPTDGETATIDVSSGLAGYALVTVGIGNDDARALLYEVELCSDTPPALLAECVGGYYPRVAGDAAGRLAWTAFAFGTGFADRACTFHGRLAGCAQPPPGAAVTMGERMVVDYRPSGSAGAGCFSMRGGGAVAVPVGTTELALMGRYSGTAFSGAATITSEVPKGQYSGFFAMAGSGSGALDVTSAWDLGLLPQTHGEVAMSTLDAGGVVFASTSATRPYEEDEPVFQALPENGYFDALVARRSSAGQLVWATLIGAGSADFTRALSATSDGLTLSLRTYQTSGGPTGHCDEDANTLTAGCAVFLPLDSSDGAPGEPLVLDAPGQLDEPIDAFAIGDDLLIAGSTGGSLPEVGVVGQPGYRNVYFARVPKP